MKYSEEKGRGMNEGFEERQYVDVVEVFAFEQVTPTDLAALTEELNRHIPDVRTTRIAPVDRPRVGAGDIPTFVYITIAAANAVYVAFKTTGVQAYMETIFSEMAKDHYQLARKALLNLYSKSRAKAEEDATPHYWNFPMAFVEGRARFIFQGELTDEELVRRLRRAEEFVRSFQSEDELLAFARQSDEYLKGMADHEFDEHAKNVELNLFWDERSSSWRVPKEVPGLKLPFPWGNITPPARELARTRMHYEGNTARQIRDLATLLNEGLINQEEFEDKKRELLRRM
jgi:hypothetical protein